jgi:hypothetical protein
LPVREQDARRERIDQPRPGGPALILAVLLVNQNVQQRPAYRDIDLDLVSMLHDT